MRTGKGVEGSSLSLPGPWGCATYYNGGSQSVWEELHRNACIQNRHRETKYIDTHRHTNTHAHRHMNIHTYTQT